VAVDQLGWEFLDQIKTSQTIKIEEDGTVIVN